jgi:hypothetical protein
MPAQKSAKTRAAPAKTVKTPQAPAVMKERMLFTRDEEHAILVRVVDKFLLFGFAMVGLGWYWLVTKVLMLTPLQEAVVISGFGIIVMLLVFSLISRDYEFRRHHTKRE